MSTASRRCMVYKCGKTSRDRLLSFHSFPKRKDIRDKWIINIKLGQPDWAIPKCSSSKYYAICSRHFERHCFRTVKHKLDLASRNTLKIDAVPTLYMNGSSNPSPLPSHTSTDTDPKEHNQQAATNGIETNGIHTDATEPTSSKSTGNKALMLNVSLPRTIHDTNSSSLTIADERIPKRYALASRRCMVLGCSSTSRDRSLSFHAFPKKLEFREEWLTRIKINRPNWSPNWPESNYYAVCSKHFTPDCFKTMKHNFCSTSRNTLRPDAVPTLQLTNPHSQNSEHSFQQPANGTDMSYPGSSELLALLQNEEENSWIQPSSAVTDFLAENGDWESPFVDATTQTVEYFANGTLKHKQTRTVRVQTMITIKKSVQDQATQYDIPTENGDAEVDELPNIYSNRSRHSSGDLQSTSAVERVDVCV